MTATTTPYLSKSRITSRQRCSFAAECRYRHDLVQPPSWKMVAGSAHEKGPQDAVQSRFEGVELAPSTVVERSVARWEEEVPDCDMEDESPVRVKDEIAASVKDYATTVLPDLRPLDIGGEGRVTQVPARLPLESDDGSAWAFELWLDATVEHGELPGTAVIIDQKATNKAGGWKEASVDEAPDWSMYQTVVGLLQGVVPWFAYHVSRLKNGANWPKTRPPTDVFVRSPEQVDTQRTLAWLERERHLFNQVLTTGGTPTYGWQCDGCGYRQRCEETFGRRPPSKERKT